MRKLENLIGKAATLCQQMTTSSLIGQVVHQLQREMQEFSLSDDDPFEHIDSAPGLYLIEVKFPFSTFRELQDFGQQWNKGTNGSKVNHCPVSYPSRIKQNMNRIEGQEFVPLYLGKQQKVKDRLNLHLTGDLSSTTYGLKLRNRKIHFEGCRFQVAAVVFDIPSDGYFCIELIEAAV